MLGVVGELALLVAFVACVASGVAFFRAARAGDDAAADGLKRAGRWAWGVSGAGSLVAAGVLWALLFGRDFAYSYAHQHTSHEMPWSYTFSALWAGQEGSFLLWVLMTAAVGALLVRWSTRARGLSEVAVATRRGFEAPVMAVVALCQAFLLSMIVGLKLGPVAIGASPFITLAEKYPDAPFIQAGGIPADGQGLNDLLQNPWMVIHPPTLFVGFTLMMVPFAFAVAGLWQRKYTEWARPALPWTSAALGVLGLGIMMGGYWAYVTLSFGGWWAWDPVENASLVPWLVGIAGLHAMLVQRKTAAGHKASLLLMVLAFAFVVYSTFLTRSGVLGSVSVHSFVDLGLYNQLLVWIVTICGLGFGLFALRYRELPSPAQPPATLSRESMIFTGALVFALAGLVIILGTSAPIFGKIFRDNPSAVPMAFYNTWTLPLAVAAAFLAGLGQLFWWRKMRVEDVNRVLLKPLGLTVASTAAVLLLTPFTQTTIEEARPAVAQAATQAIEAGLLPGALGDFAATHGTSLLLLLLVFASFFALYGNAFVLWRVGRGNARMAGGSVSHVGFALVLLGIFGSSVFNDPVSDGNGTDIRGSRDNFVVERGQTLEVDGYRVAYTGTETNAEGRPVYVLDVTAPTGAAFQARNVVYQDARDQWIQHPYVRAGFLRDLYVAVYPSAMNEEPEDGGELLMERGQTLTLAKDGREDAYTVRFVDYDLAVDPTRFDIPADSVDLAVGARLEVTDNQSGETRELRPVYVITKGRQPQFVEARAPEWSLGLAFVGMKVESNAIQLVADGAELRRPEWVVVQAYEKPFISVLWLGTLVLIGGFALAAYRRATDDRR